MNRNEFTNKPNNTPVLTTRQNPFLKIQESEIYMIKENNVKKVHETIKNSFVAKPNDDCNVYKCFKILP